MESHFDFHNINIIYYRKKHLVFEVLKNSIYYRIVPKKSSTRTYLLKIKSVSKIKS